MGSLFRKLHALEVTAILKVLIEIRLQTVIAFGEKNRGILMTRSHFIVKLLFKGKYP